MTSASRLLAIIEGAAGERFAAAHRCAVIRATIDDLNAVIAVAKRPDAVLLCIIPDAALRLGAVAGLSDSDFKAGVSEPLALMIKALQAIGKAWPSDPPPVFCIGPAIGLSGAEGLALLTALLEGERALMKSAARQWGARGFRFAWIALNSKRFAPELADANLVVSQDPDGLALGEPPDTDDLSGLLALLSDARAKAMTGETLIVDGGELMAP